MMRAAIGVLASSLASTSVAEFVHDADETRPLCGGNAFFDLGSNRGDTVLHWYKREIGFGTLLDSLPTRNPWRYCVVTFEANPKWTPTLMALRDSLAPRVAAAGGALEVFNDTAASVVDGFLNLYVDTSPTAGGSSIVANKIVRYGGQPVQVRSIDFPAYFEHLTAPKAERPRNARVVLRLDVEGAEYDIFKALFVHDSLCLRVDVVVVEFHAAKFRHDANIPPDIDNRIRSKLASCGVEVWEYGGKDAIGTEHYGTGNIARVL